MLFVKHAAWFSGDYATHAKWINWNPWSHYRLWLRDVRVNLSQRRVEMFFANAASVVERVIVRRSAHFFGNSEPCGDCEAFFPIHVISGVTVSLLHFQCHYE